VAQGVPGGLIPRIFLTLQGW